jgi:hypothetical protein
MVGEYMKLYDLIIIKSKLNTFNSNLIDLIFFSYFFACSLYIYKFLYRYNDFFHVDQCGAVNVIIK